MKNIKKQIYNLLEEKMLTYQELITVRVEDNNEKLAKIVDSPVIKTRQLDSRMLKITGSSIYAREEVYKKLQNTAILLQTKLPGCKLEIVYGYRALSIQKKLFNQIYSEFKAVKSQIKRMEAVHRLIAVPKVSGHPTGGAVDIQILDIKGVPLNFGTKIWEFTKNSYSFSPFISKKAWKNRQILREIMIQNNFAPFDGEWWHFSFGDREWARYYNKKQAIYEQVDFRL